MSRYPLIYYYCYLKVIMYKLVCAHKYTTLEDQAFWPCDLFVIISV